MEDDFCVEKRSGKAGSESAKIRTGRGKMESWRAIDVTMEAVKLKMEPWKDY
jgi:hypothetical protein